LIVPELALSGLIDGSITGRIIRSKTKDGLGHRPSNSVVEHTIGTIGEHDAQSPATPTISMSRGSSPWRRTASLPFS
jgi:hypothetical protein